MSTPRIQHLPGEILGFRKDGRPIYTIAGGAADTPGANGSDLVSPVSAAQNPNDHLTHVDTRISGGAQASSAAGATEWAGQFVTTAYDLVLDSAYRQRLIFDQFATKKPTRLTHNGAVVSFSATDDLPEAADLSDVILDEDYDVLPSKFKAGHVEIGMGEYGRAVTRTNLLRGTSMVPFDPEASEKIARNAVSTMDRLALKALTSAGGMKFTTGADFGKAGGAVDTSVTAGKPTATLIDIATHFETLDVEPFMNGYFAAVLTPADGALLRKEADAAGWRYWQINQEEAGGTGNIARRTLGVYEGFMIFTSNRIGAANGGNSIFFGADALAKVYPNVPGFGPAPQIEAAPVVDRLRRFWSIGWLWTGGYGRYKAEAVTSTKFTA